MGLEDKIVKPTFKKPDTQLGKKFDKNFKQQMSINHVPHEYLKEVDSLLAEKEQSFKRKIFNLAKMEALVHNDEKLSGIYNQMAEEGEEKYGYHYNETIMNLIFNEYVLNSPVYLQKYKMAVPKEKKRRDKSGIHQLQQAGEKEQQKVSSLNQEGELHNNSLPGTIEELDDATSGNFGIASGAGGFDIGRDGVNRTEKMYDTMKEPIKEHHLHSKEEKIEFILQHTYDDASDSAKYSKDELNGKSDDEIDALYHKVEKDIGMVETTGAASSGAFSAPLGTEPKKFVESEESDETLDETTTSASSGQYSGPAIWAKNPKKARYANKPAWKGGEIVKEEINEANTKHINVQDPANNISTFGRAKVGKTTTKSVSKSPTHTHGKSGKVSYGKGFAKAGHTLTSHHGFSHNAKSASTHAYHTHQAWGNKGTHKAMKKSSNQNKEDMKQNTKASTVWAGGQVIGDNYLIDPKGFRNIIKEIDEAARLPGLHEPQLKEDHLNSFEEKLQFVVDAFNKAGIPVNPDELRNNKEAIDRLYNAIENGMFAGLYTEGLDEKNDSDVDDSLIPFMSEWMNEEMTPDQTQGLEVQMLEKALGDLQSSIDGLKKQGGQPSQEALNNVANLKKELQDRGVQTQQPKQNMFQKLRNVFKPKPATQPAQQQTTTGGLPYYAEGEEINANPMNEDDAEREKKINDIISLEVSQYGNVDPQAEEYMRKLLDHMNDQILNNFYMSYKQNNEPIEEKAKSVAQQNFMGMVHAAQKGELKNPSPEVEKAANSMSKKDAKDFASTKHAGLPQHVKKESIIDQPPMDDRDQTSMKMKQTDMAPMASTTSISPIGGIGEAMDEDVSNRTKCNKNQVPVPGVPINKEGGCKEKVSPQDKVEREKNPHNLEFRKKRLAKYQSDLEKKKTEYQKELEQNKKNMEKSKKKATNEAVNEDRKPSALVSLDRLKKDNEANFEADLKKSNIKDAIDTENELKAKDQVQEVGENPYALGEELEANDLKRTGGMALKNEGDSTNDEGDEIPKRNLTKEEESDVKNLRGQQSDWVFDNKPAKRFEERMEKDMGSEIYKQRQEKMKFKADAPMFNKDTIPTGKEHANDTQFNKYKTGWNERDGLKESMITGKYIDENGTTKFVNFKLVETEQVEKPCDSCLLINLDGLGNSYTTRVHENTEMRNLMDAFKFYMNGGKVVRVKTGKQTLTESTEKEKPVVNEQFETMKKLMNYDPSKYVNTDSIKKIVKF